MMFKGFMVLLIVVNADSAIQNVTCPQVASRELDLKELDGIWYISAVATDLQLQGDCAMVVFNHKTDNTTDISISWITNNTANYLNGSVALTVDPNNSSNGDMLLVNYTDNKSEMYSFLDVDYEHYAIMFACYDSPDGNSSTYGLWELTRTPHLKDDIVTKFNQALSTYNLQDTILLNFNNTEDSCKINAGDHLTPSLIMSSVAAISLFRLLY